MILVFVEHDGGRAERSSLEALTVGRGLAERLSVPLEAILIGPGAADVGAGLGAYGVSRALAVESERIADYAPAAWGRSLARAVETSGADLIVAAGTDRGHEVLAHAAAMTDRPMAANCIEIEPGEPFRLTRQRWGGSLLEEATLDGPVRYLTVAVHVVEPAAATAPTSVAVERVAAEVADADLRARVVSRVAPEAGKVSLADARVVVGGGRGVGGGEAFAQLEELAGLLGGAVGVSRVVTSAGWRPHAEQVGQTGTRIAPDLYIACGISGAIQHIVGCKASKAILVINTDRDAPIMARASYAVIGDLHTVVPAISAQIRLVTGR
jgi:electron transfer flavoprotein alpha subunit